ncbi:[formate-C-acetyltransferase]-activating enzyme [Necropsobacter rosorum]|uniref:[formate-C-acetyltransferase]-activating enzyme n=1 Tax=Necropsobacter rosorum TaxID=908285 RepID=UPI000A03F36F
MTLFAEQRISCKSDTTSDSHIPPLHPVCEAVEFNEQLAHIFNIQRYSLNDGNGIRTVVFFKGCPHICPWCANPESISPHRQLIRRQSKCIRNAVCTNNPDECPSGALEWIGYNISLNKLIEQLLRDEIFYRTSGGGVTLSGGEVLLQAKFARNLLKELKTLGIHTAIETAGDYHFADFAEVVKYCDEVLFDFKIMDETQAKQLLHIHLHRVLNNFTKLYQLGTRLIPRLPLIPHYTLSRENITKVLDFLRPFEKIKEIHILPFHKYGESKYELIEKPYKLKTLCPPSTEDIEVITAMIEAHGYKVIKGG